MQGAQSELTMSDTGALFDDLPQASAPVVGAVQAAARARVVRPNRSQIELRPMDLESLLPAGHRARPVWAWVERQDLSAMYAAIKVRDGGVGRSAIAPEILFALWLYAPLQGGGQCPPAVAAGDDARCLPLDQRRGAGQQPRAVGLPGRPRPSAR
jgi:hypothetical protein